MENAEVLLSSCKDGLQSVKELEARSNAVCFLQTTLTVYESGSNEKPMKKTLLKRSSGFYAKVTLANGNSVVGVFTNNHVISSVREAAQTTATFCYDDVDQGSSVKLQPDLFFATEKILDYTFVGIDEKEVDNLQLGISPIIFDNEGEIAVDDTILILQHPQGRPKEFSHEKVTNVVKPFVYYKADTDKGSSGSPVFKNLKVIAVHHKGFEKKCYNKGTLCSEILSHLNTGNYTPPTVAVKEVCFTEMAGWLTVPCKRTESVDFKKPIEKFIKHTYSEETVCEYSDQIAELTKLRSTSVLQTPDKHEAALEPLYRYYDQLTEMEGKLPISKNEIRLSFTWYDAFDKGSMFGHKKCSLLSGPYERLCLLFNIGALQSQIASSKNLQSDDGIKSAVKMFQTASGVFQLLKDSVYAQLHQVPTPDMAAETLNVLHTTMLAQAQDCIWYKTEQDKMKDAVIASVAAQASDFYKDALQAANTSSVKQQFKKEWALVLSAKQQFFMAIAEYHEAIVSKRKRAYGENVARLQKALQLVNVAVKQSMGTLNFKTWCDRIKRACVEAEKENHSIYHELVPNCYSLPGIARTPLAKALQLPKPASSNFIDLFAHFVPMAVHEALQTYVFRKAAIVNSEIERLKAGTARFKSLLVASIESLSGDKIPQWLLEKSAELRKKGGLAAIVILMQDMQDQLARTQEIADEFAKMLDEEECDDTQMRERFKDKWVLKASAELTTQIRQETTKYQRILHNATNADAIVREKYNTHRQSMGLLCKSEAELAAALPSSGLQFSGFNASPTVQELRKLMEEVDIIIKAELETIQEELKHPQHDMTAKFLSALAANGSITDVDAITNAGLCDVHNRLSKLVNDSLAKQEKAWVSIEKSYKTFMKQSEREAKLKELATGYDIFLELLSNLHEGTKFYIDFKLLLVKFQQKVSDFVVVRKKERDDLRKYLHQSLAD